MRLGPRKVVGLAVLLLVVAVAIGLAWTGSEEMLLALVVVTAAGTLLVALQAVAEVRRVRRDVAKSVTLSRDGLRLVERTASTARETQRSVVRAQADTVRGVDELAEELRRSLTERQALAGHLADQTEKLLKQTSRVLAEMNALAKVPDDVAERLLPLEEGTSRQNEALAQLRADMEWLEDILAGQASSLGRLAEGAEPSREKAEDGPPTGRTLAPRPGRGRRNETSRRVNTLLAGNADARYLEIGLDRGYTFEDVEAAHRWGVDPQPQFVVGDLPSGTQVFAMTSDAFFEALTPDARFDLVFVDGLHVFRQAYRDVVHALRHIAPTGIVLVDDVVPIDEVSALPDLDESLRERRRRGWQGTPWHGDVYRLVPVLRDHHPELEFRTIVGGRNEQLVVWRRDAHVAVESVADADLEAYASLEYGDVFHAGVPEDFRPLPEGEAIASALHATGR